MQATNAKTSASNSQGAVKANRKVVKPADIKVGVTYQNRGAGKTFRKVIAIGPEHRPTRFLSRNEPPNEDGVLYEQNGVQKRLYISSFAGWCSPPAN